MDEQVLDGFLQHTQARWISGGTAPSGAAMPAGWDLRDEGDARELGLLALVTQCRQFVMRLPEPGTLLAAGDLPAPPARLLADAQRRLFRRVLAALPQELLPPLLEMLAGRGWMAHPFDWQPQGLPADAALPACYDEWRAWFDRHAATPSQVVVEPAEEGDWDAMTAGEQRRWLRELRMRDADAGRELFATRAPGQHAAQRLGLLEAFAVRLEAGDLPLLETWATDRSDRVRERVAQLRSRLGIEVALDDARRAELATWFEVSRSGLLRSQAVVSLAALKNQAQRNARAQALHAISWNSLAAALDMPPLDLARAWQPNDEPDAALLACVERTAADGVVELVLERLLFDKQSSLAPSGHGGMVMQLAQRLAPAQRMELARRRMSMRGSSDGFFVLRQLAGTGMQTMDARTVLDSDAWQALRRGLAGADENERWHDPPAWAELGALACLLRADVAQACLDALANESPPPSAAALDALRLNADTPDLSVSTGATP